MGFAPMTLPSTLLLQKEVSFELGLIGDIYILDK